MTQNRELANLSWRAQRRLERVEAAAQARRVEPPQELDEVARLRLALGLNPKTE